MQTTNEPFLKHLNVRKTPHVIVTAEDEEFDDEFLSELASEGFKTSYVPMLEHTNASLAQSLHDLGNRQTGVSDRYAIIAFGDAATSVLESHWSSGSCPPRLCALIAYYPSSIPDPARTSYPMSITVLLHLVGPDIGVRRTQQVLGVQGKRRTTRKNLSKGLGIGGELKLNCPSYVYKRTDAGFAEHDLEEFDPIDSELSWTRTLQCLRESFGIRGLDIERIRDKLLDSSKSDAKEIAQSFHKQASVICVPTSVASSSADDIQSFYDSTFRPSPEDLNARLISRTIGVDKVVDEMALSFEHNTEIPWLLPRVPPTHKQVDLTLVSIVTINGGKLRREKLYWDHASVLLQIGLIDVSKVPEGFEHSGVEKLPMAEK